MATADLTDTSVEAGSLLLSPRKLANSPCLLHQNCSKFITEYSDLDIAYFSSLRRASQTLSRDQTGSRQQEEDLSSPSGLYGKIVFNCRNELHRSYLEAGILKQLIQSQLLTYRYFDTHQMYKSLPLQRYSV